MSTRRRDSEDEETPLLREDRYLRLTRSSQSRHRDDDEDEEEEESELIEFSKEDEENPRAWSRRRKLVNVCVIASMSFLSPLSSSIFAPGIGDIADDLGASENAVIACQAGFVVMLGFGPLILAPLSETFGRKKLYLICFGIFALLQIPAAMARDVGVLIAMRTVTGFFGSVSIANGGGTISDMYDSSERASVLGWYLLGPLLGPSIGPLIGGLILSNLSWPWLFWILLILSSIILLIASFFLQETYVPTLLSARKAFLQKRNPDKKYHYKNENAGGSLPRKLFLAIKRPMKILFLQPIVSTMAIYQALLFATTYTLNAELPKLYGPPGIPGKTQGYGFTTLQTGLVFLAPGLGFLIAVIFIVPQIDVVYNHLSSSSPDGPKPEFRLPIANIGSLLLPPSIFSFAWLIQFHTPWPYTLLPLIFYGIGQVCVFNSTQNYYIDSFEEFAASAIAAGAFFRSVVGGIVPIFAPALLGNLGAGWGLSIFGFVALVVAPSPVVFYYFGERVRRRFEVDLG